MTETSSPPPAYGEYLYTREVNDGKVPKKIHVFRCASHIHREQNQTAITMDKNEKEILKERLEKVEKQYSSLVIISLCAVGLLFLLITQTRANTQQDRNIRKYLEEIKVKDAEIVRWMQKYDEKSREMKTLLAVSTGLVKVMNGKVENKDEEFSQLSDRLQQYVKNDAHETDGIQGKRTFEERVVVITRVGNDGMFGFHYYWNMVDSVKDGWPAKDCGLKAGDEIISIDGVFYSTLSREEYGHLLEKAWGIRRITLVVRSNPDRLKELTP